jgi:hypothetical protein
MGTYAGLGKYAGLMWVCTELVNVWKWIGNSPRKKQEVISEKRK